MKFHIGLKYNRTLAVQNKKYLARGVYILHPNMRTYVRLRAYSQSLKALPAGAKGIKPLLRRMFGVFFSIVVLRSGEFSGEMIYFTNTGIENLEDRECKIFSKKKNSLITLTNSKHRFELYIKNRRFNQDLFPMPELYATKEDEFLYVEEYIHKVQTRDTIEIALKLFEFYRKYYVKCKKARIYKITSAEDKLASEKCPILYMQHGDLSIDNFILCNKHDEGIIFIDFEHEAYFPPFYDVLFFIFNQLIVDGNYDLLNYFQAGGFDKYFIEYAKENDVTPVDIVDSCIQIIWNTRLQRYSDKIKEYIKEVFAETICGMKQRML